MLNNSPFLTSYKTATRQPAWEGQYLQAIAVFRQGALDLERLTLKRAPIPMDRTHVRFMTSHRNLDLVTDALDSLADTVATLENLATYHKLRTRTADTADLTVVVNHLRVATASLTAMANRRAKEATG